MASEQCVKVGTMNAGIYLEDGQSYGRSEEHGQERFYIYAKSEPK